MNGTFWNTFEKTNNKPKQDFIKIADILEMLDKDKALSSSDWTDTRFMGPIFGTNTITVPIIKDGRFFRKQGSNQLIGLPKQSLGYDYRTKQLDESKCPYLQHVTLENDTLLVAVINYVKDSTIKDKEHLLKVLENDGLREAYWVDKQAKDAINESRELSMHLGSIAKRGNKEYYTNILVYSEKHPITEAQRNTYTDFSIRTATEQQPKALADYTEAYNAPVYFKDNKDTAAITPVRVLKLSESVLRSLFEDVVKLNTVIVDKDTREKVIKGVEDPEFGCIVLARLEELSFRGPKGDKMHTVKFSKGERSPLTEAEKKYLLWDLNKIKTEETYDQAYEFLKGMGYCDKMITANKVAEVVVTPPVETVTPIIVTTPVIATIATPIIAPTIQPAAVIPATPSTIPAEAVETLPWGDGGILAPAVEVVKPVKEMVQASDSDDFNAIFES